MSPEEDGTTRQPVAQLLIVRHQYADDSYSFDSQLTGACDCSNCMHNYAVVLQCAVNKLVEEHGLDSTEVQEHASLAAAPRGRPN